ncbi:MAG TPA: hypothetical protein VG937_20395 [Polyangiaceae bacterium]|nr:hypothetical protein [Polyangiaceae bacterium]
MIVRTALAISVLSLILSLTAYWRAGGRQDIDRLRRDADALRVRQQEAVATAFQSSRERLRATQIELDALKQRMATALATQVGRAEQQLDALSARLEEAALAAKDASVSAAERSQQAIARRARRLEAGVILLSAKAEAMRAVDAAKNRDFVQAEQRIDEATELLQRAREKLGEDAAYDEGLMTARRSLREATNAIRNHAADTRERIDQVLNDTNKLVESLQSAETQADSAAIVALEHSHS